MRVHLSTATVTSYENRRQSMNLHFNPVVLFEDSRPFPIDHLRNISWSIEADPIGRHDFELTTGYDSPFELENDRNYIEFFLSREGVPFQYDDYPCQILFSAILDSPHSGPIEIDCRFFGVVKTVWSRGLR
ncbi:hypothetical protein BZJ19_04285 [Salinivibrio proteolyticus]|nr:hypothetical protein BZJ19_04285 [Salinivibrio proteolyticus]